MKVKIVSGRVVGYKVGARVDVDTLEADGVNVRQWLKCGLVEEVKPKPVVDTDTSTDEGAD